MEKEWSQTFQNALQTLILSPNGLSALTKALPSLRMNELYIGNITEWLIVLDVGNVLTTFTHVLGVVAPFLLLQDRARSAAAAGDCSQPAANRPQPSVRRAHQQNAAEIEDAKERSCWLTWCVRWGPGWSGSPCASDIEGSPQSRNWTPVRWWVWWGLCCQLWCEPSAAPFLTNILLVCCTGQCCWRVISRAHSILFIIWPTQHQGYTIWICSRQYSWACGLVSEKKCDVYEPNPFQFDVLSCSETNDRSESFVGRSDMDFYESSYCLSTACQAHTL